jgi:hypothetical protein
MTLSTYLYQAPFQELRQSSECCPTESRNPRCCATRKTFPALYYQKPFSPPLRITFYVLRITSYTVNPTLIG